MACTGKIIVHSSDKTAPVLCIEGLPGAREIYQDLQSAVGKILDYTARNEN